MGKQKEVDTGKRKGTRKKTRRHGMNMKKERESRKMRNEREGMDKKE